MRRRRKGFSLIELMIVVTVIGILSAVAIPTYMGIQKRARRSEFKTNLEILRLLEEKAFAERGAYVAGADTAALMAVLPEFKPGDPDKLYYEYSVVVAGPTFTAQATGKPGTSDEGLVFSVDQDNNRVGW